MGIAYTKTATSLSLVLDFKPVVIPSSHPNFDTLVDLVRDPATTDADLRHLIDIPKAIETFTGGNVTVTNGRLFFRGFEVKSSLATTIIKLIKDGQKEAARPFELFMEKAFNNPDPRAAADLFDWVAAANLPITPDGDILAWKAVQDDYYSIRSGPRGKLRHRIGDVVTEPREETDSNPDQTCSRGLHFAAASYLRHYANGGSRIVAVAISPTDVVAFPKDYGNAKGRCCRMTVVGEVPLADVPNFYPQAKKVYGGWTAQAKAEPTSKFNVGERWLDEDGDTWQVDALTKTKLTATLVMVGRAKTTNAVSAIFDPKTGKSKTGDQTLVSATSR